MGCIRTTPVVLVAGDAASVFLEPLNSNWSKSYRKTSCCSIVSGSRWRRVILDHRLGVAFVHLCKTKDVSSVASTPNCSCERRALVVCLLDEEGGVPIARKEQSGRSSRKAWLNSRPNRKHEAHASFILLISKCPCSIRLFRRACNYRGEWILYVWDMRTPFCGSFCDAMMKRIFGWWGDRRSTTKTAMATRLSSTMLMLIRRPCCRLTSWRRLRISQTQKEADALLNKVSYCYVHKKTVLDFRQRKYCFYFK